jgi:hypothetical protein
MIGQLWFGVVILVIYRMAVVRAATLVFDKGIRRRSACALEEEGARRQSLAQRSILLAETGTKDFNLRSMRCGRRACSTSFESATARVSLFIRRRLACVLASETASSSVTRFDPRIVVML